MLLSSFHLKKRIQETCKHIHTHTKDLEPRNTSEDGSGGDSWPRNKIAGNFPQSAGLKKNPLSHSSRCYINSEPLTQQNKIEQQQSVQHTTQATNNTNHHHQGIEIQNGMGRRERGALSNYPQKERSALPTTTKSKTIAATKILENLRAATADKSKRRRENRTVCDEGVGGVVNPNDRKGMRRSFLHPPIIYSSVHSFIHSSLLPFVISWKMLMMNLKKLAPTWKAEKMKKKAQEWEVYCELH